MTDKSYITADQAMAITGLKRRALRYHALRGNIRTLKALQHGNKGFYFYLYHIDDIRVLTWPTTSDIAKSIGISRSKLSKIIYKYDVEGAVKMGIGFRFPPDMLAEIVDWAMQGYKVRKKIGPKNR